MSTTGEELREIPDLEPGQAFVREPIAFDEEGNPIDWMGVVIVLPSVAEEVNTDYDH